VLRPLIAAEWAPRTLMNVNFPPLLASEVAGIKAVGQGLRDYGRLKLDKRTDPRGFNYYWFGLGRVPHTPVADTDLEAIEQGWITVTPLHLDLTHRESLVMLNRTFG
jgi:5'-nucleotidase